MALGEGKGTVTDCCSEAVA
ncbi:uncharacterized protein G2W53_044424 [Senna tora]|uniref:Uncharacterized protein n=1 Tax=Senna tora TaxID=362788 RepID=A0A834SCX5_9FABA|nr:uncharacterized protein G2W53_044424 [Senna tora]